MKSRELILWVSLLVLAALLIRSCGNNPDPDVVVETQYIKGETDTLIIRDTITMVIFRNHPKPVKTKPVDSIGFEDGVTIGLRNPCDSVRTYQDSIVNKQGMANVGTIVRGEMISQSLSMKVFNSDTTFTRVDTIRQTFIHQKAVSLSLAASVDLINGPGIGAMVGIRKWNISYQYFPINKSNQIGIAYTIFSR